MPPRYRNILFIFLFVLLIAPLFAAANVSSTAEALHGNEAFSQVEAHYEHEICNMPSSFDSLPVQIGLLALGALLSEDLTCIVGGILASKGLVPIWAAFVGCGVGIYLGDIFLYYLGYLFGPKALSRIPLKWLVKPKQVERISQWYAQRGGVIILSSRFLPGTRIPVYVAAGVLRIPIRLVAFYYAIAVALWTPVLVSISYLLGSAIVSLFAHYTQDALLMVLGIIVCYIAIFRVFVPLLSKRGRRLMRYRWRRIRNLLGSLVAR